MEDYVLEMEEDEVEMQDIIAERNLERLISNERGCGPQETVDSAKDVRDGSVVMMLSDPDVLDCSICFESLTIPVFQCDSGHIANCSTCCTNLRKKCAVCSLPIGFNRCRPIENVLQSIRISCPHAKHGCNKTISYSEKRDHEKECTYVPCHCPVSGCDFVAPYKELSNHLSSQKHGDSRIQFSYGHSFQVSQLEPGDYGAVILQEQTDGKLFILKTNSVMRLGNGVNISCIGPYSSEPGNHYDILAKSKGCSLELKSFTKNVNQGATLATLSSVFLMIPFGYFGVFLILSNWKFTY